jgi:uncharacterized protein YecE (DUF72 family)
MINWQLGTMGFGFQDWEGPFYPQGYNSRNYLRYYSRYFTAVELDTTFYGPPRISQVKRWLQSTPAEFIFCAKVPRQITHKHRLIHAQAELDIFLERMAIFGNRLGAILVQLPPDFSIAEVDALRLFLETLPREFRYAVEFRHLSWYVPETLNWFADPHICWAATEYLDLPAQFKLTANFGYVRWIGEHGRYDRKDHERVNLSSRLVKWADNIIQYNNQLESVYGFFNNDYAGFSPATCNRFKQIVGETVLDFRPPQQGLLF